MNLQGVPTAVGAFPVPVVQQDFDFLKLKIGVDKESADKLSEANWQKTQFDS
jgi:hypothetical protein